MEQIYKDKIEEYHKQGVSLAGIISLLCLQGFEGMKYTELRKVVKKECQRLDS